VSKKLIVFCDGTWNRSDQKGDDGRPCPTNVLKLFEVTLPYDKENNPQVIHYVEGVGTRRMEKILGGGFGYGISDNIKNAYSFIVSNYQPGDEIFLFGFSRGAYTARSIAGMIRNVGILRRDKLHLVQKSYDIYKDKSPKWHPKSKNSIIFREENTHQNETIKLIGVWDTVGALGAPFGAVMRWILGKVFDCRFHDVRLSSIIESAYHALAIDERRWPFRPTLWQLNEKHQQKNADSLAAGDIPFYEQKWFPGVHSNVGGGYPNTGLSNCTLDWMATRAVHHGLNVDLEALSNPPYAADVKVEINNSQTFFYRTATFLFVKMPSSISIKLIFPKEDRAFVKHIQGNGDYVRPISYPGNIGKAVADYPDLRSYQGDISDCAIEKLATDGNYTPGNVPK